MSLQTVACVYTDVLSDGSSTVYSVDLATGPVSFQAGINAGFPSYSGDRQILNGFDPSVTPPTSAISAIDTGGSASSIGATMSGTVLTLTFTPANPNGYVARVITEVVF